MHGNGNFGYLVTFIKNGMKRYDIIVAGEGDATALEVFRKVGEFIGKNIK